jgi:hypothetical protein
LAQPVDKLALRREVWDNYLSQDESKESNLMAAMKPRTGDGPMEAERETRGLIVLRVPLEGGGRLVVSVNDTEAKELYKVLEGVVKK